MSEILRAAFLGPSARTGDANYITAKTLIAQAGSLPPNQLSAAHIAELDEAIKTGPYTYATRAGKSKSLRYILRWLWENHGAPKLDQHVRRYPAVRPRNVLVTDQERERLLTLAKPHIKLWLLFCSDLAMRSGTAAQIGPANYDSKLRTITFATKYQEHLTLPVTHEIAEILATCDHFSRTSYVRQLWQKHHGRRGRAPYNKHNDESALSFAFRRLCESAGITRYIRPHDLRRTTAVAMLQHSGDVRDVQALLGHRSLQSTIWYLDHDLRPIKRSTLELIKRPEWRKEQVS